jgi:aldehyde dehydrogenase (NAD+)
MTRTDRQSPPSTGALDADRLVAALRHHFHGGATRLLAWRRQQLEALRRMLTEREPELLEALRADLGKPPLEGWMTELEHVANEISHILRHLEAWTRPARVGVRTMLRPARATIVAEPLGVVLVIAPWNYPVHLTLLPMAYALAGGNCVVGKPSEVAPASSAAMARWVPEYLDSDAVAIVEGDADVVTSLLTAPWDHIFYTGNGRIGRTVMSAAADHLTPVTLELGGKSPVIVDRTANLEVAAKRVVWGKFVNAGQTCVAPDYVLVDRTVEPSLVDALATAVRAFYADDPRSSPDYGRIINERHWDRLQGLLADQDPADLVVGGDGDRSSRYLAPTILRNASWHQRVMQEEIFGPILPVLSVEDVGEAIEIVNGHHKPLALYVFAEEQQVIERVVSETSSGGVGVNVTLLHLAVTGLPFGGVGHSGMGAYHGKAGFDTFTHHKSILQRPTKLDPALTYPPYTSWKRRLLRKVF